MGEIMVPLAEYRELVQIKEKYKMVRNALYFCTTVDFRTWSNGEPYITFDRDNFFDMFKIIDGEYYEVLYGDKLDKALKEKAKEDSEKEEQEDES